MTELHQFEMASTWLTKSSDLTRYSKYASQIIQDTICWLAAEKIAHCSIPPKPIYCNSVLIIFLKFQTRSLRLLIVLLQKHLFPSPIICYKSQWPSYHFLKHISIIHYFMTLCMLLLFSQILWYFYLLVNFFPSFKIFCPFFYLQELPEFHQIEFLILIIWTPVTLSVSLSKITFIEFWCLYICVPH